MTRTGRKREEEKKIPNNFSAGRILFFLGLPNSAESKEKSSSRKEGTRKTHMEKREKERKDLGWMEVPPSVCVCGLADCLSPFPFVRAKAR